MIDFLASCLIYCWNSKLKKYVPAPFVLTYYDLEQLRSDCPDESFIACPVY